MNELMGDFVRLGFLLTLFGFAAWVGGASVTAWVAWEKGREPEQREEESQSHEVAHQLVHGPSVRHPAGTG